MMGHYQEYKNASIENKHIISNSVRFYHSNEQSLSKMNKDVWINNINDKKTSKSTVWKICLGSLIFHPETLRSIPKPKGFSSYKLSAIF